jgi:hypothetical protein
MQSILVTPPLVRLPDPQPIPPNELTELVRQMVDLQRQQLELTRNQLANQDERNRVRQFHKRHEADYPELPNVCKQALPTVEKAYLGMLNDAVAALNDEEADTLGSNFGVSEFLDNYGVRLIQLGNLMGLVGQFANLVPPPEAK